MRPGSESIGEGAHCLEEPAIGMSGKHLVARETGVGSRQRLSVPITASGTQGEKPLAK